MTATVRSAVVPVLASSAGILDALVVLGLPPFDFGGPFAVERVDEPTRESADHSDEFLEEDDEVAGALDGRRTEITTRVS